MQLTKTLEKQILKIYDEWMHSYLNGDVKTYDSYLDDDYHFIGSTDNEEFLSRKATTNFFKDTAEQFSGKTELRNETTTLELFGELVFITHVFDAWFLNGNDWTYYARFRFSSVLKEKEEGWRFIYQHFSIADSKADEGETIGFDKVNLENQELREAIKRRTFELEEKNRELEVEGALERIRAQAVAMKASSDLLDIVVTMRSEFIKLGHEAHYFWHMMWLPEKYEKAMTSGDGTKIGFVMELPRHIHGDIPLLAKWEKSKKSTVVYAMNADEAIDYVDKMVALGDFKNIDPQAPSHDDIRHIKGLTFIMARTSHGEIGYSLPGLVKNPPKEDIDILVKFSGAFDLAHQRFLDLQKAEAQARETQIELALEKVRSRTMGMQRSDELRDTAMLLFQQAEELGINSFACGFNIWDEDKKFATAWMASKDRLQPPFKTNSGEDVYLLFHEAEKRGDPLFVLEQEGKELEEHYKYLISIPEVKALANAGLLFPTFQIIHCAYFSKGYLMFITHEPVPDEHDVFKRFAKVFEQTYTRFLDLQKAESQARESEIELAIERVRARTMAMQHSDELQETSFLLDEQVRNLGIKTWGCAFNIYGENDSTEWFGNEAGVLPTYTVPRAGIFKEYYQKGQKGESLIIKEFSGKACVEHYEYMSSLPVIGDVLKNLKKTNKGFPTYQLDHVVFFKYGYLLFITKEHVPESHDIFKRFAKVFQQTYTRFLDLQKAEAQIRESQIEASLERVRASAMAMHKSDDLTTSVDIVFSELGQLGFNTVRCGIGIFNDQSNRVNVWTTSSNNNKDVSQLSGDELLEGHPLLEGIYNAWKAQVDYSYTLKGADLKNYYKAVSHSNLPVSGPENNALTKQFYHLVNFPAGGLFAFKDSEFELEEKLLMKRFGEVFHLSFTRHLDLKQAEAQARESEIELALERVRARSMAMQKSDELKEAIKIVYQQLSQLNININHAGFVVDYTPKGEWNFWIADEQDIPSQISHPYFESVWGNQFNKAKKKGGDFFATHLNFEEKNKFYNELLSFIPELPKVSKDFYLSCPGLAASTVLLNDVGLYIENFEGIPYSDEENDILMRFGKVFQQTYTRFLDLQKAEAQAKESQIELGLERVRARAMAMQKSDELSELVSTVRNELTKLDFSLQMCIINIINEKDNSNMIWAANSAEDVPESYYMKFEDYPYHDATMTAFKAQKTKFVYTIEGEEKLTYDDYLFKETEFKKFSKKDQKALKAVDKYVCSFTFSNFGGLQTVGDEALTDENLNILARFGKVFDLTYTRFRDLEKAEAQAKEAQIETALERVRSQSMGMQSTDDLGGVTTEMFNQLRNFGEDLFATGIVFCDKHEGHVEQWHSIPGGGMLSPFIVPVDLDYIHQYRYDQWKKGETLFSIEIPSDFIEQHFEDIFKLPTAQIALKDLESRNAPMPKAPPWEIDYGASFKNGYILVSSLKPFENTDILQRFAKVFEQAYTRFLDLQKAEAQAREAQIEAALEKVRSRTMAMQQSDELPEAANNLFLQVQDLGIPAWSAGYCIWDEGKKNATANMSSEGVIQKPFVLPNIGVGYNFQKPLEKGESFHVGELGGKTIVKHYEFMRTLPIFGEVIDGIIEAGFPLPTFQIFHIVYFSHGYLMFITYEPVTNDWDIFKRFGKVFEQTYTRFLDLQNAEAQTREAQINLAVERVRAKALAMHKSEEIMEVVAKLKDEVMSLDIPDVVAATIFLNEGDDKVRMWDLSTLEKNDNNDYEVPFDITFKLKKTDPHLYVKRVWENTDDYFVEIQKGKDFKRIIAWLRENGQIKIADEVEEFTESTQLKQLYHAVKKLNNGKLVIDLMDPPSDEMQTILTKMGAAFDLAYKRFEDLQKAEAQTREAQIEAALERTRTQSMLMQHSDELNVTAQVFHQQLQLLGIDSEFSYLWLPNESEKSHMFWATWSEIKKGKTVFNNKTVSYPLDKKEPAIAACYTAWASEESVHVNTVKPNEVKDYFATWDELLSGVTKFKPKLFPEGLYYIDAYMKYGCFGIMIKQRLTTDEEHILSRFSKEFERTYSRFLGLQKAEAQAREAKIEAALERVRSKAMAMHSSEDISHTANAFFNELKTLDISMRRCGIGIVDVDTKTVDVHVTTETRTHDSKMMTGILTLSGHFVLEQILETFISKEEYHPVLRGKELSDYYKAMNPEVEYPDFADDDVQYGYYFHFKEGGVFTWADKELTEADLQIFRRYTSVLSLTYRRYLDLKEAEAQAKEAQIETALEKVRSRTMAMQKGEELQDVVVLLYKELIALGVTNFATCGYVEINEETNRQATWVTNPGGDSLGLFHLPLTGDVHFDARYDAWKKQQTVFHQTVAGKERRKHLEYAITTFNSKEAEEMVLNQFPDPTVFYCFNFSHGYLHLVAGSQLTQDEETLLARFTKVFEQTYARFLDLKKAEAQAREAQIEAALEKVRSRSLAMHKPDELQEVVTVVAEKLTELGVILDAGGVIICTYFPDNKDVMHWISAPDFSHSGSYFVPYFDDKTFNEAWDSKNSGESYFSKAYPQEEKNKFFEYAFEHSDYRNFPDDFKQLVLESTEYTLSFAWQKHSAILIPSHSGIVPSESDAEIMKRFAKVFEQAYIRFMDLQKVEAQAREAQIETALEKVRSRTMAMQKSKELPEAASNLFLQVQELGIPAWSAGYCIWQNDRKDANCNMSTKGEIQKNFILPSIGVGYDFYNPQKAGETFHVKEIGGEECVKHYDFMKTLPVVGEILKGISAAGFELPTFQIFHIVYFKYGYVMFITYESVPDAHDIFKRFGQVFNQTYTRFLDLKLKEDQATKLAKEKRRLEQTLNDLQSTQKQLIQSEKMASLGELTAGIAHEIQNPLNFVNNFSEVSKELLEEMLEEMEKGDMEEVKAIMDDVVQNLEKINHHGNRADGIVKGMLQHSRASGDKKEPTDINALADEYLRLAYHGLRAKDKAFNSELVTNFDDTIKTIDVIPQDIGRVILNLLTNAFYVVNEKKKSDIKDYNPTVSISTKKKKNNVVIKVKDNGNGIPKHALEKIFQPFFTTKPTGQGTGLGLSMSYDIVTKGHGGKLKVETEPGDGTEFKIILPI